MRSLTIYLVLAAVLCALVAGYIVWSDAAAAQPSSAGTVVWGN